MPDLDPRDAKLFEDTDAPYGMMFSMCAHGMSRSSDGCDRVARHHKYGMDRCDDHQGDLDPANRPLPEWGKDSGDDDT